MVPHPLITNDSRIEGTLVGVASRLSDRVVQVMVNEGDTVHKGQGLVRIDSRSVMARKAKAEAALELAKARWEDAKAKRPAQSAKAQPVRRIEQPPDSQDGGWTWAE